MRDWQFQLQSGFRLGYREYGPKEGSPIFYFHGSPSARIEYEVFSNEERLFANSIRLISVDRPGMGLSDFQPKRKILSWPADILALANHLQIDRFSILAYSLGGPYGLACAFAVPEHLNRVGIISGAAIFANPELMQNINPGTRNFILLPKTNPGMAKLFLQLMKTMVSLAPGLTVKNAKSQLPEPDRNAVSDTGAQKAFIAMVREAFRQGIKGVFFDSLIAVQDWGFRLSDIRLPVHLWHGEADRNIPVVMANFAASEIPHCIPRILNGEGHLSLFKKYAGEILQSLAD